MQMLSHGGHAWALAQYLLGLRGLGWKVLFIDWVNPADCSSMGPAQETRLRNFFSTLDRFGFDGDVAVVERGSTESHGLPRQELLARCRRSVALINIMGFLDDEELLEACDLRVLLDIDPGFGQMWKALDLADVYTGHERFVTIAENIGRPECTVPTCELEWITTRQPIALDLWPAVDASGDAFTSIASWRGPYAPIEYDGRTYGLRVHEFRKFVDLPRLVGGDFELALDIHPDERSDLDLLERGGWRLVRPQDVAGDPWLYQRYIQGSKAEFMVAKGIYVDTRSGWFSDRSICYLASGKPVLAQDTGLRDLLPTGEGLLVYSTLDEAVEGVQAIRTDYHRHSRAAREIAEEFFDSRKVLGRLLERLGLPARP